MRQPVDQRHHASPHNDSARLDEFLNAYEQPELDEDDRFVLMELVVASLDRGKEHGVEIGGAWHRAEVLIPVTSFVAAAAVLAYGASVS